MLLSQTTTMPGAAALVLGCVLLAACGAAGEAAHVVRAPSGVGDLTVTAMASQPATLPPSTGPDLRLDVSTATFTG